MIKKLVIKGKDQDEKDIWSYIDPAGKPQPLYETTGYGYWQQEINPFLKGWLNQKDQKQVKDAFSGSTNKTSFERRRLKQLLAAHEAREQALINQVRNLH